MKSALGRDFLTGLTALAGLVGLVITLWLIGDLKDATHRTFTFTLKLNSASTVGETSRVALNGVKIGNVFRIENEPNPADGVLMILKINDGTKIPEDFTVYVDRGFVGESVLQLDVPEPSADHPASTTYVKPGSVHARRAKTLFDVISDPLKEPLSKLNTVADNIQRLSVTYDEVGKQAVDLMKPRTLAEVQAGAAPNLRTTLTRIEQTLASANAWLGDETLRGDAKSLITKADNTIDKVALTADAWTAAAKSADAQIAKLGPQASAAVAEATASLRRVGEAADQVNQVMAAVHAGTGTAAQLLNNPDLYNNLRDAASRLEKALTELQLLLEKYKTEGLPIKL